MRWKALPKKNAELSRSFLKSRKGFSYSQADLSDEPFSSYFWNFDKVILAMVVFLLMLSILMVYSSSYALSRENLGSGYHFLKMQIAWIFVGLTVMIFTSLVNYQKYAPFSKQILLVCFGLLVLIFVPGLGVRRGGALRWVHVWKFSFQPVEFMKVGVIIYMAEFLDRRIDHVKDFKLAILPGLLVLFFLSVLLFKQPDFGSVVMIVAVVFGMLIVGGTRIRQMTMLIAIAAMVMGLAIWLKPYRFIRWTTFLHPWRDPDGAGYHIIQSFYAFGYGGILGTGLGGGIQKLNYLPTPHTDFIFAVIGEELGLVGSLAVTAAFATIVWRGMRISMSIQERFGSLLALGITLLIGIEAAINIGVVTGSLPTKGLTLPFVSFGGSSMVSSLAAVGILLNISRFCERET